MVPTMIERVARAIAGTAWNDLSEKEITMWENRARAAITAMRRPSHEMLEAGPGEPYMDDHVWKKMMLIKRKLDEATTAMAPEGVCPPPHVTLAVEFTYGELMMLWDAIALRDAIRAIQDEDKERQ